MQRFPEGPERRLRVRGNHRPDLCVYAMNASPRIVPPKPVERRLLRRMKAWACGRTSITLTPLTVLLAIDQLTSDTDTPIGWFVGCAAPAGSTGILALVFRSIERPSEIIIRGFPHWPGDPPVIH